MRTHNMTQAQELGSFARLIQARISLASKPCAPGKRSTFPWITGTVLLRKGLILFWIYFFNKILAAIKFWIIIKISCYKFSNYIACLVKHKENQGSTCRGSHQANWPQKLVRASLLRLYSGQLAQHFVNLMEKFLRKYKENNKIILNLAQ